MQDASVNLLLLDHLRFLKAFQGHDELLNTLVHLVGLSGEDVLEVFVRGPIDFLRALGRTHLSREQDRVLRHQVLYLRLDFVRKLDKNVLSLGREMRVELKLTWVLDQ